MFFLAGVPLHWSRFDSQLPTIAFLSFDRVSRRFYVSTVLQRTEVSAGFGTNASWDERKRYASASENGGT